MADVRGDIKDNRIFMGNRWIPINNPKGNLPAKFPYPDEVLLFGSKVGETATETTAIGAYHRDLSEKKADVEGKKDNTRLAERGDTIVTIALSASTLSPEAQVAIINGLFASVKK